MRKMIAITLTAGAVFAAGLALPAVMAEEEGVEAKNPELISLRFYADWCGFCRQLDAMLDEVKREFEDQPVLFTHVDLTDEYTTEQSGLLAAQLGLGAAFEEYGNSTGDMALIDPATGEVKDHITHDVTEDELRERIAAALPSAA